MRASFFPHLLQQTVSKDKKNKNCVDGSTQERGVWEKTDIYLKKCSFSRRKYRRAGVPGGRRGKMEKRKNGLEKRFTISSHNDEWRRSVSTITNVNPSPKELYPLFILNAALKIYKWLSPTKCWCSFASLS